MLMMNHIDKEERKSERKISENEKYISKNC